jgi:hypothetical protein
LNVSLSFFTCFEFPIFFGAQARELTMNFNRNTSRAVLALAWNRIELVMDRLPVVGNAICRLAMRSCSPGSLPVSGGEFFAVWGIPSMSMREMLQPALPRGAAFGPRDLSRSGKQLGQPLSTGAWGLSDRSTKAQLLSNLAASERSNRNLTTSAFRLERHKYLLPTWTSLFGSGTRNCSK